MVKCLSYPNNLSMFRKLLGGFFLYFCSTCLLFDNSIYFARSRELLSRVIALSITLGGKS